MSKSKQSHGPPTFHIVSEENSKATHLLTSRLQLRRQKEQVKRSGCGIDKHNIIHSSIFNRFTTARENEQHVTTQTLQQWRKSASFLDIKLSP